MIFYVKLANARNKDQGVELFTFCSFKECELYANFTGFFSVLMAGHKIEEKIVNDYYGFKREYDLKNLLFCVH